MFFTHQLRGEVSQQATVSLSLKMFQLLHDKPKPKVINKMKIMCSTYLNVVRLMFVRPIEDVLKFFLYFNDSMCLPHLRRKFIIFKNGVSRILSASTSTDTIKNQFQSRLFIPPFVLQGLGMAACRPPLASVRPPWWRRPVRRCGGARPLRRPPRSRWSRRHRRRLRRRTCLCRPRTRCRR